MAEEQPKFESWAVVEIMGRVRTGGRCSEQVIAGVAMLRVDVPDSKDAAKFRTIFYGGSSIYSLHPTDETTARAVAAAHSGRPVYAYEIDTYLAAFKDKAAGNRTKLLEEDDDGSPLA